MKYFFYIIGILISAFAPIENIGGGLFFILLGIILHLTDINEKLTSKIEALEKSMQSDHAYLKRDIKDLVNQK